MKGLLRFVVSRLLGTLAVLLVLSVFTFALAHAVPGGPYAYGEIPLSEAQKELFRKQYGLDKPLWEQYLTFLSHAVRLDFGVSYQSPSESVSEIIGRTWPVSIQLGLMASLLAILLGLTFGLIAAYHQNTWIDYLVTFLSTMTITTPSFVIGAGLILLMSVRLHWLPTGGWDGPKTWIMPVVVMAIGSVGTVARYTRGAVLDVARADFVRTARAKGLAEYRVATRHVLRNALIPILTATLPIVPGLITGTIFIEGLFRIPGLGSWFVSSSFRRDYPMILGITMLWAALISITYLVTDICYAIVDPRVRLGDDQR
jgi:ABC-type dipeptide/oligopeptide/nickel transport system permease component